MGIEKLKQQKLLSPAVLKSRSASVTMASVPLPTWSHILPIAWVTTFVSWSMVSTDSNPHSLAAP